MKVKVGQIWDENDKDTTGCFIKVVSVGEDSAEVVYSRDNRKTWSRRTLERPLDTFQFLRLSGRRPRFGGGLLFGKKGVAPEAAPHY